MAEFEVVMRQGGGRRRRYCDECRKLADRLNDANRGGFSITLDAYVELLENQNHVCAICHQPETYRYPNQKTAFTRLSVDHCHESGKVRALLCRRCNTGLGQFRDDPAALRLAAAYLEAHAA